MNREINFNFFNNSSTNVTQSQELKPLMGSVKPPHSVSQEMVPNPPFPMGTAQKKELPYTPADIKQSAHLENNPSLPGFENNLDQLKLDEIKSQLTEYQNSTKVKIDRLQASMQKFEQNHNGLINEISEKFALMIQKLNEQKKYDQKVQDIVDRHNNLLKGYEVRMSQLQKLLQQKESDYIEANSSLKELKAELARLKRV